MDINTDTCTAAELLDFLDRDAVRSRLIGGDDAESVFRGRKSINQAAWAGSFAASWYGEISALCNEKGIECPARLFNFKSAKASA